MIKPKVSVIVPVYNTEAYVEAAVRSVMEQTLHEIEIVVIDDGSTDGSAAILERMAREDDRICVYAQLNKGLSEARNAGITHAEGCYLYFMDSDDLLEADALELCYEKCEKKTLDMLFFDAEAFGADTAFCPWFDYHRAAAYEDRVYRGRKLLGAMLGRQKYIASACLYLIRRDFLSTYGLAFYPRIFHEDELFTTQVFLCAERVGRIDRAFFKRRLRPDSIMGRRFSERNLAGYMTVFAELTRFAAARDEEARRLVGHYLHYTLNPVLRNAWALPFSLRLRTAMLVARHYLRHVEPAALGVLLLKASLKRGRIAAQNPHK